MMFEAKKIGFQGYIRSQRPNTLRDKDAFWVKALRNGFPLYVASFPEAL